MLGHRGARRPRPWPHAVGHWQLSHAPQGRSPLRCAADDTGEAPPHTATRVPRPPGARTRPAASPAHRRSPGGPRGGSRGRRLRGACIKGAPAARASLIARARPHPGDMRKGCPNGSRRTSMPHPGDVPGANSMADAPEVDRGGSQKKGGTYKNLASQSSDSGGYRKTRDRRARLRRIKQRRARQFSSKSEVCEAESGQELGRPSSKSGPFSSTCSREREREAEVAPVHIQASHESTPLGVWTTLCQRLPRATRRADADSASKTACATGNLTANRRTTGHTTRRHNHPLPGGSEKTAWVRSVGRGHVPPARVEEGR